MNTRLADLDHFYDLLAQLDSTCGGKRRLDRSDARQGWPKRGVYFFFEDGELREDGVTPRVVRVGTHALRASRSTLWGRLVQHKGSRSGSMPGGGNHRGSIFRLHIGTALLAIGDWPDSVRNTWGVGSTANGEVRRTEYPLERAVSDRIGAMPFLWLDVDDQPSPQSDRGVIEVGAIELLSNLDRPSIDPSSKSWLGRSADRRLVRESGLWNVNHVQFAHDSAFLEILERHVVPLAPKR